MAAGYDRHGLPARPGRATRPDALADIDAAGETAKFCCVDGGLCWMWTPMPPMASVRLNDDEVALFTSCREVKALFAQSTGAADGAAHPGLELPGHAKYTCQPRANHLYTARDCTG